MTVDIRPLAEADLAEADRIFRLSFGTFVGLPDPMSFMGDADLVFGRWRADPAAALGAYRDGELVGSNFAANWGSFGFFGPLTVRPDLWGKGIAQQLLEATMPLFDAWGTRQVSLFTFPHSTKHIALYQKYDFWPQQLTLVAAKQAAAAAPVETLAPGDESMLRACRAVADAVYPGLDLTAEITSATRQRLGETVLLRDGGDLAGFALCHLGSRTEAGGGSTYVKFGAVRPGPDAARHAALLLDACEALAAARGQPRLVAGVNTACHDAYRLMLDRGFRTFIPGLSMQRGNGTGYNRPDRFAFCDWR